MPTVSMPGSWSILELELLQPGDLSPPELAEVANREHALTIQSVGAALAHAVAAGDALIAAKSLLQHGEWLPWLAANFAASQPTASRYMTLARNYSRENSLEEVSIRKALEAVSRDTGRSERDGEIAARRVKQLAEAQTAMVDYVPDLVVGDVLTWRPTGVSAIVTDPPYITDDAVELHRQLGDFAVDVLPEGGALAVLTWQPLLPAVFAALTRPELVYRWTAAWVYETSARTPERRPRVFDGWKPVLVYHKGYVPDDVTYLYDVVRSPDADKEHHEWGQAPEGFAQLVRAFSEPGELVCDPFLGAGTTAVAALSEWRRFCGCDIDPEWVQKTQRRLYG